MYLQCKEVNTIFTLHEAHGRRLLPRECGRQSIIHLLLFWQWDNVGEFEPHQTSSRVLRLKLSMCLWGQTEVRGFIFYGIFWKTGERGEGKIEVFLLKLDCFRVFLLSLASRTFDFTFCLTQKHLTLKSFKSFSRFSVTAVPCRVDCLLSCCDSVFRWSGHHLHWQLFLHLLLNPQILDD